MIELTHPALAWGALAGLLPLAIHLIDRRRARPHPFAAIDFVLRSRRQGARRLRLKRLLLLALRTVALIAIPLALARPRLAATRGAQGGTLARGPAATALLLDGSGSMGYRKGGQTLFSIAQNAARARLASLAVADAVTVGVCAPRRPGPRAPTVEHAAARAALDGAAPSEEPTDLSGCLAEATLALGESPIAVKRIVLFTDLTAADWDLARRAPEVTTPHGAVRPEVEVVDVAGIPMPNHAIQDLSVAPAPDVGPRAFRFNFTVHNYSDSPAQNLVVSLKSEAKVLARGFCDLAPGGSQRKSLATSFPPGTRAIGSVELEPDDLPLDDSLAFTLAVPRELRVLLVDGAPSTFRYRDEAFFAQTALEAGASGITTHTVDPESLGPRDLEAVDVVFLLNVRTLEPSLTRAVERFVDRGGGLFIALGDRVDPERSDEAYRGLLPLPLRLVKTAAPPPHGEAVGAAGSPEESGLTGRVPAHFANLDMNSTLFSPFSNASREGLLEVQIFRYFLVDPSQTAASMLPRSKVHLLASFDDGAPALIETRRGLGRTILFTSSVAREWSDWPIRSSFVPVLQRIARLLAGEREEPSPLQTLVGHPHPLGATGGERPVMALGPAGQELPVVAGEDGGFAVPPLPAVGHYRVRTRSPGGLTTEAPDLGFSVIADPIESDTTRLPPSALRTQFGAEAKPATESVDKPNAHTPLWSWLLATAVLSFFLEGLLLRR